MITLAMYVVVACNAYGDCYQITDYAPSDLQTCERHTRFAQAYIDTPTGRIHATGYKWHCIDQSRVTRN